MISYIHRNLPLNAIVRLLHPWRGKKQGPETFLARSADIRNHNYNTECSNCHLSLSTLWSNGFRRRKMKFIYIQTYQKVRESDNRILEAKIVQSREKVLEPCADNRNHHYNADCSSHHPSLSRQMSKRLSCGKMK